MAFHFFHITELYSNADGTVQYVEFLGEANSQNVWDPQSLVSTDGVTTNTFGFPSNLPNTATNGKSVLVATQAFADLGIITPDYIIPDNFLFTGGGTVYVSGMDTIVGGALPTDGINSVNYTDTVPDPGSIGISNPKNFAGHVGGTIGADNMIGTAAADSISGGPGNDSVDGGALNDSLVGGTGDDSLVGGAGNDTLVGGADNDTYVVDVAGDVVTEGLNAGTDLVLSSVTETLDANVENLTLTGVSVINGTGNSLNNQITGNSAANSLAGGDGNDVLDGLGGVDTLTGGAGDDYYVVDVVTGPLVEDLLVESGGGGVDTIELVSLVGSANFTYTLGAEFENLFLYDGVGAPDDVDWPFSGIGNDAANWIVANAGGNTLTGNGGNDTLEGAGGDDTLNGGAGNDTLDGGAGSNTVRYESAAAAVTVDLANGVALDGDGGTDTLIGIGRAEGSNNGDTLIGDGGDNFLDGGLGNDTLSGGAGNDTLDGGTGIDTLGGGAGSDAYVMRATAVGGPDGITFVFEDVISETGVDADTVYSNASHTLAAGMENLILTGAPFWRAYTGTGNELGNVITGEGAARQRLFGEGGADTLDGGGGLDTLDGGAGDDVLVYDALDPSVNGGTGTDTLTLAASGVNLNLTTIADTVIQNVEVIDLTGAGNNTLTLAAADVLAISGSTDTLRVGGGAGDAVDAGPGWTQIGNATIGANDYAQYTRDGATLQVDLDVDRGGIVVAEMSLSVLDGANGFQISGEAAYDYSGRSVSGAGDVNGDGFADLIVGAPYADTNGLDSGGSYVVFGQAGGFGAEFALSALNGTNGFQLSGEAALDYSGRSVSGAGDVNGDGFADLIVGKNGADLNGDGFADLIVGTTGADPNGNSSGASYVVFGQAGVFGAELALSALDGTNGFQISGEAVDDFSGRSVSGAGDVNGDGFADLIVGAHYADLNGSSSGASYVVFGQAGAFGAELALSALDGTNGFQLSGEAAYDFSGVSVSAAGDVNGDGFADLIVGAHGADPNGGYSGASYVVFGQAGAFGAELALSALDGTNGFQLSGEAGGGYSGRSVSGAGDVNGDGFADLIVGAHYADLNGSEDPGASYVVFGQAGGFGAELALSALNGTNGFQLSGEAESDYSGRSVSGAGDMNGDGFADLIVGADGADPNGNSSGASYVVFGQAGAFGAELALSALDGANGFQLSGEAVGDFSGRSVSGAGDVNGDGFADLIVGADRADPNGNSSGASYVVFGRDYRGDVDFAGGAGNDGFTGTAAAEILIGGLGDDTLAGGGGADVFRGGEGDDRIVVSDTGFFDVDGGTGSDTLALDGSGLTLDLTLLADSKLTGIEIIDLTGSGNNTLALTTLELLNLSDTSNTLRVDGNADDAVSSTGQGWVAGGTVEVFPTVFYQSYTDGAATLLLDPDIVAGSTIS